MSRPLPSRAPVRKRAGRGRGRYQLIREILYIAAAIATILTLAAVFWPTGAEACTREGASLSNITVEERVAFREYLDRTSAPTEGYGARQLEMPVNLISYDLHVDGFKRQHLTSKWSVYEAKTNSPVADASLRNRLALDVEPTACETNLHPAIWTPIVSGQGTFYFKLFVYDQQGTLLAEQRSAPLSGQS